MAVVLAGQLYCDLLPQDSRASRDEPLRNAWLQVVDGKIQAIGVGTPPAADTVVDFSDAIVAPAFIDMHVHGGGGHAFDEIAAAVDRAAVASRIAAAHQQGGTQKLIVSLVTADIETLCDRARAAAELCASDDRFVGIHLEGPFLAPERRGAHDPQLLCHPTPEAISQLLDACGGYLKQITIAPELPGAMAAIKQLVAAGVRVAVGHSECDYRTAAAAFGAGATILTHAFNAMPGLQHRAPGPVAAAFDAPEVTLEVIADGEHVDPRMVRLLFENAPGRVALISDAMAAAGMPDGEYVLGALPVQVQHGLPRLLTADGTPGNIAGSTLRLLSAVNNVTAWGVPLGAALAAVTSVPAAALGIEHEAGRLRPGMSAQLTVLAPGAAAVPAAGAASETGADAGEGGGSTLSLKALWSGVE